MSTMTAIQEKAGEAYEWFEMARHDENDPDNTFVRVKDGAPKWIRNLVYAAHGDFLPDDWRYDKIQDALGFIRDADSPEDGSADFADQAVDVYTSDRIKWLGSNLNRAGYCDQAVSEYGAQEDGADIVAMIGWGQYMEAEEVYAAVLNFLRES